MLVSVQELHEMLSREGVVVFDCRFSLQDPGKGRQQYLEGHIPGAFYLHLNEDLSAPIQAHGGRHPLPSAIAFSDRMKNAGVNENSRVVVYDNGEGIAPRAWWLMRYFGHDQVAILDGGWNAWVSAGLSVHTDAPKPKAGGFIAQPRTDWIVTADEVEHLSHAYEHHVLIDARAADRYRGENETIDPVGGHIPGALNAPWMEGMHSPGVWKTPDEQRARFDFIQNQPAVVYCGSGVTACANLFAMELAGIRGAKLYPGSWSDWCSYPEHPVATGEEE
jgi:thiosulfate/3-mercaptopyruvate sulfurtransferase